MEPGDLHALSARKERAVVAREDFGVRRRPRSHSMAERAPRTRRSWAAAGDRSDPLYRPLGGAAVTALPGDHTRALAAFGRQTHSGAAHIGRGRLLLCGLALSALRGRPEIQPR